MAKKEASPVKEAQKRASAAVKKAEKLAKEVREALIEAGYEFPAFLSNEYRQEFIQKNGYDPETVFLATLQVAELDEDWKKKIVTASAKE